VTSDPLPFGRWGAEVFRGDARVEGLSRQLYGCHAEVMVEYRDPGPITFDAVIEAMEGATGRGNRCMGRRFTFLGVGDTRTTRNVTVTNRPRLSSGRAYE
jgi:hypothetical protein